MRLSASLIAFAALVAGASAARAKPAVTGAAVHAQGQACVDGQCPSPLSCVKFYGIAGPRGPQFTSCELRCDGGSCPAGQRCVTIADGPGQVCRPSEAKPGAGTPPPTAPGTTPTPTTAPGTPPTAPATATQSGQTAAPDVKGLIERDKAERAKQRREAATPPSDTIPRGPQNETPADAPPSPTKPKRHKKKPVPPKSEPAPAAPTADSGAPSDGGTITTKAPPPVLQPARPPITR